MSVPKLRFKEFNDNWYQTTLSNIAVFLDGKRKPIKESDRAKIKGAYPYYGASGIIDYVNDYIFDDEIILLGEDGENIVSRNLPLAFKVKGKCWVNNHAHVIKPNSKHNIDFITQCLENINYLQYNTGTAQPKLNQEVCKLLPLKLPSLPEQTKIADFLSAVDEKITQLTQKNELLNQYKKGVMQKIFIQELRFKDDDGSEFPEWSDSKLQALVEKIGSGGTPKSSVAEYYNGDIPWVSISDMTSFGKYITDTAKKISCLGLENSSAKLYPEGTLLFAMYASIGEVSIATLPVTTSQAILGIIPKKHLLVTDYLYFWLLSLKERIALLGQQGAQANLNLDIVKNFVIKLPSFKEQTKIANFLTAIDDKITEAQSQLELVKQYKQGLLQQMFV